MRVVFNTEKNVYEIHKGWFARYYWENSKIRGGYWWFTTSDWATPFKSPEEAISAYNLSNKRIKPKNYVTIKHFF